MDLRLAEIGGAEAIRLMRKEFRKSAFIVLTTFHGDEDIHKAMSAGARSCLLKGMSHDELLDAVRKVHAGRQFLPRTVQQSLANRMRSSDLSARQAEILGLIGNLNILFARLNVTDRTQAAVAALHRGIVEL